MRTCTCAVALPPILWDGELLIDGAVFKNFPTDVMVARLDAGRIIGSDLARHNVPSYDFEEILTTWQSLVDRFRARGSASAQRASGPRPPGQTAARPLVVAAGDEEGDGIARFEFVELRGSAVLPRVGDGGRAPVPRAAANALAFTPSVMPSRHTVDGLRTSARAAVRLTRSMMMRAPWTDSSGWLASSRSKAVRGGVSEDGVANRDNGRRAGIAVRMPISPTVSPLAMRVMQIPEWMVCSDVMRLTGDRSRPYCRHLAIRHLMASWSPRRISLMLALFAGAVAAVLRIWPRDDQNAFQSLLLASEGARRRSMEGRMVGIAYAPRPHSRGASTQSAPDLQLRAAALEALADSSAHLDTRQTAVAQAMAGATDAARQLLEILTRRQPGDPTAWSDYAAVLLERGRESHNVALYAQSLAASDRALSLAPSMPEAAFNRAMALEALHLDIFAADAMRRYLSLDVEQRSQERFLGDAVRAAQRTIGEERLRLAKALLVYRQGRIAYAKWRIGDALNSLRQAEAEFAALKHPMSIVSRYYVATALTDSGRYRDALRELGEISRSTPRNYVALHAQARWTEGTALARMRRLGDASDAYRDAARRFSILGEDYDTSRIQHMLAYVLTLLGQPAEAWEVRAEAFASATNRESGNPLIFGIFETAQQAMAEEEWDVAHSFYELALATPDKSFVHEARALAERALASWRGGFPDRARLELSRAETFLTQLPDTTIREDATHALAFVRAIVRGNENPASAIADLGAAIEFNRNRRDAYALPWMLAEKARLRRQLGELDGFVADLEQAIDVVQMSARGLSDSLVRDRYLGTIDSLYRALIDAHLSGGRTEAAFEVMERQRSEALLNDGDVRDVSPLRTIGDIARVLPEDSAMLHYTVVGEQLWMVVIPAAGAFSLHRIGVSASGLVARITHFHEAIDGGGEADAHRVASELHALLLPSAAGVSGKYRRLVFVPDHALADLPFAALRSQDAFLIESVEVVVAPSANVYAELAAGHAPYRPASATIVADPAFDATKYAGFTRLGAAAREGRNIARIYGRGAQLQGGDAALGRVLAALDDAPVLHIAAHALLDERDPGRSGFLLASDGNTDKLYLHTVAAADLRHVQLVVLAGCRTGRRAAATGNLSSLSSAFLAAGAGAVVGTLWDVDDSVTQRLVIRFHARIAAGTMPAAALRETQVEMIRGGDPQLRRLSAWASMQLYGPTS